jgi:hypothetical protein
VRVWVRGAQLWGEGRAGRRVGARIFVLRLGQDLPEHEELPRVLESLRLRAGVRRPVEGARRRGGFFGCGSWASALGVA